MADITINDLTEVQSVNDSDFIAVDTGTETNKISVENFNATGAASAAASAEAAAQSASDASDAKDAAVQAKDDTQALITSAQTIVSNASDYADAASGSAATASSAANTATAKAALASDSATLAAGYAANVDNFAKEAKSWAVGGTGTRSGEDTDNAKYYANEAHDSEINAASSESNASTSETNAAASELAASTSASSASTNALKAEGYAVGSQNGTPAVSGETYYHDNAKYYKEQAATSETNAASSEYNAGLSETAAAASESAASNSKLDSEAWAVGQRNGSDVPSTDPTYQNNAKYWASVAAGAAGGGVTTFNGRSGVVTSAAHDYDADQVDFDNTNNGFTADDVQEAIEEVATSVSTLDSSLATVAKTGAYSDLSGTPNLATVATSGAYSDLSGTPTLATVATSGDADDLDYDNTTSGMTATNAQDAIDELSAENQTLTQKAYQTDDATETTLASDDLVPFYDTSATAKKKMTVQKMAEQLISNPNLLDNPWFTVNQRGYTTDSSFGKYPADRWQFVWNPNGCTISRSGNQLVVDNTQSGASNANLFQLFEDTSIVGKMLTASVMLSDGTIISGSAIMPALEQATQDAIVDNIHKFRLYFQHLTNGSRGLPAFAFEFLANCSLTIKAVKLELGTVSTLAHDTAPNYQQELAKCQRFFYRMNMGGGIFQQIGIARAVTATAVEAQVKLPTTMRSNPSVTVGGNITAFYLFGNGSVVAASSYSGTRFYGDYKKILFSTASNLVVNELYSVEVASTAETDTTYIDFSADL